MLNSYHREAVGHTFLVEGPAIVDCATGIRTDTSANGMERVRVVYQNGQSHRVPEVTSPAYVTWR